MKGERKNIYIPQETQEQLDYLMKVRHQTASKVIRDLIKLAYFNHLLRKDHNDSK